MRARTTDTVLSTFADQALFARMIEDLRLAAVATREPIVKGLARSVASLPGRTGWIELGRATCAGCHVAARHPAQSGFFNGAGRVMDVNERLGPGRSLGGSADEFLQRRGN